MKQPEERASKFYAGIQEYLKDSGVSIEYIKNLMGDELGLIESIENGTADFADISKEVLAEWERIFLGVKNCPKSPLKYEPIKVSKALPLESKSVSLKFISSR